MGRVPPQRSLDGGETGVNRMNQNPLRTMTRQEAVIYKGLTHTRFFQSFERLLKASGGSRSASRVEGQLWASAGSYSGMRRKA